jgi:hypothetical protein
MASGDWDGYAWQLSAYMHTLNLPAIYVVKNRDSGKLLIDEVKVPPIPLKDLTRKVIAAEKWRKRGELPDCDALSGDKFFCPFPYLHDTGSEFGQEPDDELEPIDDAQRGLIAALADQYDELASQVGLMKPTDDERKSVGGKLIAALQGAEYVYAGQWKVKAVNGSNTYPDQAKLAKALGITVPELKEQYWKKNTYQYVKLTSRGE